MSALLDILRPGAIALLYGGPSLFQAPIAREIGYRSARSGRKTLLVSDVQTDEERRAWQSGRDLDGLSLPLVTLWTREINDHMRGNRALALHQAVGELLTKRNFAPQVLVVDILAIVPGGLHGHEAGAVFDLARAYKQFGMSVLLAAALNGAPNQTPVAGDHGDNFWKLTPADFQVMVMGAGRVPVMVREHGTQITGPKRESIKLRHRQFGGSGHRVCTLFDPHEEPADAA